MNRLNLAVFATFSLILGFGASAATVPLRITDGDFDMGRMYVPIRVGNFKGVMRLDTGATSSRVLLADWNKDFTVVDQTQSMSASGKVVTCDAVEATNVALESQGSANIGRSKYTLRRCPNSDGEDLLGLDFFDGTFLTINFDQGILEVGPKATGQMKGPVQRLPILDSGQPLAAVPLNPGGEDVLGMLDSGAELSAADTLFVEAHPEWFEYVTEAAQATDAGGNAWAPKIYRVKNLKVAGMFNLENTHLLVYDFGVLREALGPKTPFILGFNIMSQFNWAFDFTRGHSPTFSLEPRKH